MAKLLIDSKVVGHMFVVSHEYHLYAATQDNINMTDRLYIIPKDALLEGL